VNLIQKVLLKAIINEKNKSSREGERPTHGGQGGFYIAINKKKKR
jgi:hypothetical protein